jgi:hypothetical protein
MSKDVIKKLLENAQQYPDTTVVRFGDTEVPLGSLRALNADDRADLNAAIEANTKRTKELEARQAEILDLASKAEGTFRSAEELRKTAEARAAAAGGNAPANPWDDPWLKPVDQRFAGTAKELADMKELLKTTLQAVGKAATVFSEDRWDSQYQTIDFGKREKKPSRQELIDYAKTNNLTDRHGLPSIAAAWHKMSEPERLDQVRLEAEARGRELGRQEAVASRIPQPNVPGPGMSGAPPKVDPATGDLGDLFAKTMADPELRALVEGLPPGLLQ